jgi:hypothetical protein
LSIKREPKLIKSKELGIGFFKPKSMPASEFASLVSEWRTKLAESGFKDIEIHDNKHKGRVLPYFGDGPAANILARRHDESALDYYHLTTEFYHAFNWPNLGRRHKLYSWLWQLYAAGVSYRQILRALAGRPFKCNAEWVDRKPPAHFKQRRSLWWLHKQMHIIYPHFKLWLQARTTSALDD